MLENNFSIFGLVCFLRSGVWTSTVLTAAIGTNWVTTLRISTVHVGDLGSYVTVQLNYHLVSLFASEWICLFCVLAGEGSLDCFTWRARGPSLWPCATQTDYLVSYFQLACQVDDPSNYKASSVSLDQLSRHSNTEILSLTGISS